MTGKLVVRFAVMTLLMVGSLFGCAGRWDWPAAWALVVAMLLIVGTTTTVMARTDPALIAERTRGLAGAKAWDKFLSPAVAVLGPLAMWMTAGLERRFQGPSGLPAWIIAAGWILAMAGTALTFRAMTCNRFFAAVVRIQTERGHVVQSGGPYGYMRHPGYVGAIAFTLGVPLILDSRSALIPSLITVLLTVIRTALEDATLRRELDGYAEYASRVRFRLLPGVW